MTTSTELRLHDFHGVRRLAPEFLRALTRWQSDACALAGEGWTAAATYPLRVTLGQIEPARTAAAIATLSDPAVGVVFQIGPDKRPLLLTMDPLRLQGVFADLLGSAEVPAETTAELTPLEQTLFDLLLHQCRDALADSWPDDAPLGCLVKELCRPRRSRHLSAYDEVISITWRIECRFHAGEVQWLAPRRELEELLSTAQPFVAGTSAAPGQLNPLVEQFPLEVSVELGAATVSTASMTRLGIGDVLVLDHVLGRPLTARVSGQPLWLVEPCCIGQRQAVEVRSLLE